MTESQLPPVRVNFPSPIRARISLGVSFGPLAKGVCLKYQEMPSECVIIIECHFFNIDLHNCTDGIGNLAIEIHLPSKHCVKQNTKTPYVAGLIITLLFQHLQKENNIIIITDLVLNKPY